MEAPIIAALIALSGSLLTYILSKSKDREADWRKEKIQYYKDFIESLSGIIDGESSPEDQKKYSKSVNNLLIFAPTTVLNALKIFNSATKSTNTNKSQELHDKLLTELILEIRKDIGVKPNYDSENFSASLWASGVKTY